MSLLPASAIRPTQAVGVAELDPAETVFGNLTAGPIIDQFEQALGGREAIVGELLTSPEITTRIHNLLQLVFDPRFKEKSLGWLCGKAGIPPGEVFLALRDAMAARATVIAMKKAVEELPAVMDDLLKRASTQLGICEVCRGQGKYQVKQKGKKASKDTPAEPPSIVEEVCKPCDGTGKILIKSELEVQKLALELVGVLKKAGPQVNVGITQTANTLHMAGGGSGSDLPPVAALQQAASAILFGRTTPKPRDPAPAVSSAVIDITPVESRP